MVDYKRIHRLLHIITLIQGENGWTAERLAEHFEQSRRNIFRDIEVIKNIGIPLFFDEEAQFYRIRGDYYMPPTQLTPDEALSLVALAQKIGDDEQIPLTQSASKAVTKIRSQLPNRILDELDSIDQQLHIKLAPSAHPDGYADVYDMVKQAIATRRCLLCCYESAHTSTDETQSAERFLFKPYHLLFCKRAWYAIGYHARHDKVVNLKLSRFSGIESTDKPFMIPDEFSLKDHLGNAWSLIKGSNSYDIVLHFDAAFAETISDTLWHPTQSLEYQDDGSIVFRCMVDGLHEILWWVLSMGSHCTVVEPEELADAVKKEAQKLLSNYQTTNTYKFPNAQ